MAMGKPSEFHFLFKQSRDILQNLGMKVDEIDPGQTEPGHHERRGEAPQGGTGKKPGANITSDGGQYLASIPEGAVIHYKSQDGKRNYWVAKKDLKEFFATYQDVVEVDRQEPPKGK